MCRGLPLHAPWSLIITRPIQVGSGVDQDNVCRFLEKKEVSLRHLADKVFHFEESSAAFDYLFSGQHTGKVVICI